MSSFSQKGFEVGGWLGTSLYFGDLNTSFQIEPGYAGGLIGRYNFDERISLKGTLNYARIRADDEDSANFFERARGLDFSSQIVDATAHIEFNFFPYIHGHKELFFTPYLAIGLSATHFNPKTSVFDPDLNQSISVSLQPLGTEGQLPGEEYSRFTPGFSIGGGFKFDVSKLWSINIEIATRQVLSDHIDDVSGVYANPDDIDANRSILFGSGILPSDIADPTGNFTAGKQRGNSRDNDSYTFIGIGVLRYFGSLQCPKPSAIF